MRAELWGLIAIAGAVLGGCGADDPGAVDREAKLVRIPDAGQTVTSHDAGKTTATDGSTGGDAAGGGDGGDPFFVGVEAYDATKKPATSAVTEHSTKNPGVVPTGMACVASGCHGAGATTKFLFAGTLFADAAGTQPAVAAQVVLKGGTVPDVTYTDDNGNFWFADNGALPTTAHVGVRMAAGGSAMIGVVTDGACNSCHALGDAGSSGPAHP